MLPSITASRSNIGETTIGESNGSKLSPKAFTFQPKFSMNGKDYNANIQRQLPRTEPNAIVPFILSSSPQSESFKTNSGSLVNSHYSSSLLKRDNPKKVQSADGLIYHVRK